MNKIEFDEQFKRLVKTWPNFYDIEKSHLIWVAVSPYSVEWFTRLATDMIASSRRAPLPQEFIDAASLEEKRRYVNEFSAPDNWKNHKSIFSPEEIKEMFAMTKKASSGEISKKQAREYAMVIARALRAKGIEPDPLKGPNGEIEDDFR